MFLTRKLTNHSSKDKRINPDHNPMGQMTIDKEKYEVIGKSIDTQLSF